MKIVRPQYVHDARDLPRIDPWLLNGFERYFLPRYLSKHFHALGVNCESLTEQVTGDEVALVLYANHAAWWDPLVAIFVHRQLMSRRTLYAPIDAAALDRYRVFKGMGFYGVEQDSLIGATQFLQRSLRILCQPATTIAITPEGTFRDVRDRHQKLRPGLAHLASAIESASRAGRASSQCVWFVPVALEYCFWEERLPECLCWFGEPRSARWGQPSSSKSDWNNDLTVRLWAAQDALASASITRDESKFRVLLHGQVGTWRVYDAARRWLNRWRGQSLQLEHGQKLTRGS